MLAWLEMLVTGAMPLLAMAAGIMVLVSFQRRNRRAAMVWATAALIGLGASTWFLVVVLSGSD